MGKWAARAAWRLYDMHCHLDRMADAEATAADARELGLALLCCPIDPAGTLDARERLATEPNVRVAAGLHPWCLHNCIPIFTVPSRGRSGVDLIIWMLLMI